MSASNKVELTSEVVTELESFCELKIEKDFSLIAMIGNNLNNTAGISGKLFNMLKGYNIRMVCHGSSENNVCFLVNQEDGEEILQLLHKEFIED